MLILVIVLVVLIFGLLVFVHELGHFVAARRNGVVVHEFGFGFPPQIWGKKVGATHYSINWIPLGGFVRLEGENLTDRHKGSFGAASFWAKTKILFAGVTMNLLLAWAILFGLCLTGLPPVIANQFSWGKPTYSQPKQVMAAQVEPGSPAAQAGLAQGDVVISADGQNLTSEKELVDFTRDHAGQTVSLAVVHQGQSKTLSVTLRPANAQKGFLGITPLQTYKLSYNLPAAVVTATGLTVQLMGATLQAFANLIVGLFTKGQVSDQVAGPVGIVALLANVVNLGAAYVGIFVASISVSLAVINALPLPALDGGRWLMAAVARLSGRQLSQRAEAAVHGAGFAALILLMVVVTVFDIKRLG